MVLFCTCEAIEEETNTVAIGGANDVVVSKEWRVSVVEGYGREVEGCVGEVKEEEKREDEEGCVLRKTTTSFGQCCPKTT